MILSVPPTCCGSSRQVPAHSGATPNLAWRQADISTTDRADKEGHLADIRRTCNTRYDERQLCAGGELRKVLSAAHRRRASPPSQRKVQTKVLFYLAIKVTHSKLSVITRDGDNCAYGPIDHINLSTIRRSIFVCASLIVFVWWFGISINLEKLPGGFVSSEKDVILPAYWVISFATACQVYLLWRLSVAHPIAKVRLWQAWGADEMKKDAEFVKTVQEIKAMVEKSSNVKYPEAPHVTPDTKDAMKPIGEITSGYQKLKEISKIKRNLRDELEEVRSAQSDINGILKRTLAALSREDPSREQEVMERAYTKEDVARDEDNNIIINEVSPRLAPEISKYFDVFADLTTDDSLDKIAHQRDKLRRLADQLEKSVVEIDKQMLNFVHHKEYCMGFPTAFDATELGKLINNFTSNLVAVRDKRENEFKIFDVGLPAIIAIASCAITVYFFIDWMEPARLSLKHTAEMLFTSLSSPPEPNSLELP